MFTRLLTFFEPMRPLSSARARGYSHGRIEGSFPAAAQLRCVPRLEASLQCRWQIDPRTGALRTLWFDPSAKSGTKSGTETENTVPRRWFHLSRPAARGQAAPCHAARRAA